MKKKIIVAAAAGAASLFGFVPSLGGHASPQAMTCTPEEPIRTACQTGFGVVGIVCTGHLPKAPSPGATTMATIGWPIACPPLG